MLEKVISADCPGCGCNATHIIGAGQKAGSPWARFGCDFCGKQFVIGESPKSNATVNGVVYHATQCKCPKCKYRNPKVTSTQGRIRYHKCQNCGQCFKSVEQK